MKALGVVLAWLFLGGPKPDHACRLPGGPPRPQVGLVWVQGQEPALGLVLMKRSVTVTRHGLVRCP